MGTDLGESPSPLDDEVPFGYLVTTPDGEILGANATLCAWLGAKSDELSGRHLTEVLTGGSRIYYETRYAPMLQVRGFVRDVALDLVREDRSRLSVLCNASVVRSAGGVPKMVRVALFDATERRAYERELVRTLDEQEVELDGQARQAASATATVSQIMDAATNTLLLAMDADFVITYFNRGAQEMLGYSAVEAIGRHAEELQDPEETRRHADALGVSTDITELLPALVRHGVPTDWTMSTGAGERRTMSLSFTEIRDGDQFLGYLCAGEDVSVRMRIEAAQAAALHREVESVARLEEADKVKDEVVSTISHELRTPLAAIQGYSEILADGALGVLTPRQADAVAKVLRNAARLSSLVDDLLHLDRIGSSDQAPLQLEPTNLADLAVTARDDLDRLARGRGLAIEVRTPETPVMVLSDPKAVEQIVFHLAGNAIKFTPAGGTVTLSVGSTPTGGVLVVADTGTGISKEDLPRVREQFYRSSEAYRLAVPGTGLGLSVTEDLVAANGGTMEISSALGRGTTVTVTLPRLVGDTPAGC